MEIDSFGCTVDTFQGREIASSVCGICEGHARFSGFSLSQIRTVYDIIYAMTLYEYSQNTPDSEDNINNREGDLDELDFAQQKFSKVRTRTYVNSLQTQYRNTKFLHHTGTCKKSV